MPAIRIFKPLQVLVCLFAFTAVCLAQSPEGALVGTVTDSSGARVAGATISVHAIGFNLERKATSNSAGEFRIDALPPGDYALTVNASGFGSQARRVKVAVDSSPTVVLSLEPASVKESVKVQAGTSLVEQPIETTSTVEKTSIGAKDLEDLPLAARSFANIAYLAPMTEPA